MKVENGINGKKTSLIMARRLTAVVASFMLFLILNCGAATAQTFTPDGQGMTGNDGRPLGQDANDTDPTARYIYDAPGQTTLVTEQAEQNTDAVAQNVEAKLWPAFGSYNETYEGLAAFWGDDIVSNFFANIGQVIGKWLSEFINGWIADAVQFLTGFLRIFVLNPNIATNGLAASGGASDDISPYIRQGADVMYGIAVDLLLLLFILCIWKYWAEAAWRGGGNLMGAVGRLIFTAGLMLAWPTIYAFEIQISNEMIRAIYFNSADQVAMLDAAMAAAVKAGLVAGAGLLANATAPVAGQVFGGLLGGGPGGLILGTVGSLVAFVGLILYLVIGGILIAQLIYILILKAIQTALLCAQYMFAPIFLVFFATPDTESVTAGFVRSFVEVSLWTFVWVGLLKIMVVVVLSDFNPWGKIIMAIGVLQIMIQVPTFLARAQISPMSDFISAGLITGGLLSAGKALGNTMGNRAMHLANAVGNFNYAGAKGMPKSQNVDLNVPQGVNNQGLLDAKRQAERNGTVGPDKGAKGPDGQPLNPVGPNGPKKPGENDPNKKVDPNAPVPPGKNINPATGKADGAPGAGLNAASKTGQDPSLAANAAGAAGKGLATAATAAGIGAAMAAAQAPGLTTGPGQNGQQDPHAARRGDMTAQQAADALKALKDGTAAGAGAKGAVAPDAKDLKSATAAPGAKDANAAAEGKVPGVDAKLQDKKGVDGKANAASTAAALAGAAKDLKPGDIAGAMGKDGQPKPGAATPGKSEMDVDVERDAAGNATAAGAAAALNSLKGANDGTGKGTAEVKGPDGTAKGSLKVPGTGDPANPQVTTDVKGNLVSKPGAAPTAKTVVPPQGSAALGDATKSINRGTADPTTVAVNTDVAPEGDPGAPLQQGKGVLPTAPGAKIDTTTPEGKLNAADLAAAAAGGAVNAAGRLAQNGQVQVQGAGPGKAQTGASQTVSANLATQQTGAAVGGIPAVPPSVNAALEQPQQDFDPTTQRQDVSATVARPGAVGPQAQASVNPADLAAAAGTAAAAAGARQNTQQVTGRVVSPGARSGAGSSASAPQTQFTQSVAGGNNGSPPPPPVNYSNMATPEDDSEGYNNGPGGGSAGNIGNIPPTGPRPQGPQPAGPPTHPDVIEGYNQAGYNKVPFRVAAANIRLAQGATIGRSNTGSNYAVYDSQGHVMHYRFDENASQEQKGMAIIAGAYGELMSTDAEAFDAARVSAINAGEHKPQGAMERMSAGILAYNGSSWTQTAAAKQRFARSMAKHAAIGSQAYVTGEQGNAYTEFLENRYGKMDDDRQAEAVHIMTTDATPESGWSWRLQPATEALIQNGIGINPLNRACAANGSILRAPQWLRGPAIRGSAAYLESKANQSIPEGTHPMVKDSWYANQAQVLAPEVTACVGALTLATGDVEVCRQTDMVDKVVSMVPVGGKPEDYVGAYNSLKAGTHVVSNMIASGGGGGGGGSMSMPSQRVSASGGGVSGGVVTTSVSGSVVGGGGGMNNVDMDLLVDSPSQSGAMPNINPASINLGNQSMPGANTNVNVRTHAQQGGGQNLGNISMRVPGGSVGAGQGNVQIGSIQNMGSSGNRAPDQVTVDVEIGSDGAPGSSAGDIQNSALNAALQHYGGDKSDLVKNVVVDLRSAGMSWSDIQNPNLLATAIQSYSTNPNSLPQVSIASNAMGADSVTTADVQLVQDMQDADPRWDARSIDYGAIYTSRCIVEAHMADPQAYGQPYLTKDYVDKVRLDPRFRPREVPRRGANGQVGYGERTPVPPDIILNHLQDQMRRYGG